MGWEFGMETIIYRMDKQGSTVQHRELTIVNIL